MQALTPLGSLSVVVQKPSPMTITVIPVQDPMKRLIGIDEPFGYY
ncbi:hypothetical protein [Shewanella phaeophyticola]|uniref:Uncharacterized protein n=1 Tax=Shewanella phaeophyticola TaxID=2978345 RepID=A0ABT2P5H4_9GAMM|nr:hypothetical protein [Shewanella sp. KJ10-1]MCT8987878.1 hypothetical protein [Shewanella sp. KJ10-1]